MHRLFLILWAFLVATLPSVDAAEADSLSALLKEIVSEKERLQFLNDAAFNLREKEVRQSLDWSLEAEQLALNLEDSIQLATAKSNLGWLYYRLGIWEKSFNYSRDAYIIGSKIGYRKEMGMALNNLGALYYQRRNFTEAIQKFKEALQVGYDIEDDFLVVRSLNNIALNFSKVGELDSAYWYAKQALKINEDIGEAYFSSFTNRVIGDILLARGQVLLAISTFERALAVTSSHNMASFEASILHRLGKAYISLGDNSKAREYLEKGLLLAEEGEFKDELLQTYRELANLYHNVGNVEKAYQFHQLYTDLNSFQEEENDKERIAVLQAMFEVEKSDAEISFLKMENSLKELEIRNFKRLVIVIAISVLVALFLLVRMVFLNNKLRQAHSDLEKKKDDSELQRQELETKSLELSESNRVKNRIFSILGHDLKTPVAQLKGVLDLLHNQELSKEEFEGISHILKRNVDGLFETIDNILVWSKSQMDGFRVQPTRVNLIKVVRPCMELLQYQAGTKDIIVYLYVDPDEEVFADSDLLQLVIRNLLSNAIKFSNKGSRVDVMSKVEGDMLQLIVQDFGTGMSEVKLETILNQQVLLLESSAGTDKEKGTGLGLSLCKEFLSRMEGNMVIESKKGEGTKVTISLPRLTSQRAQPALAQ